MRRLGLVAAILAILVVPQAAQGAGATLTEAGDARFPERAWLLTLPSGGNVPASAVSVTENRNPVTDLRVAPAGEGGRFGVVLAIDTSKSMAGAPIRDAMAAAREFARQRPAGQPLAIVTFNSSATVLLKPTTNAAAIDAALAAPPSLAPGTHLYDATSSALKLLRDSRSAAGAVVVLSDGSDLGSTATPASLAGVAREARARVFTVAAGAGRGDQQALRELSERTSGEFLGAAQGRSLVRVYRRLGGQLASAYLVRYRSLAPAGRRVSVRTTAGGEVARAGYRAPALSVAAATGSTRDAFLATTPGIVMVSLAALLAAFLLISQLLLLRGDRGGVRERVGRYGSSTVEPEGAPHDDAERPAGPTRHSARRDSLAESLDIARMRISPELFLGLWALAGVCLTIFAVALSGTLLMLPVALGGAYLAGRAYLSAKVERQRTAFAEQLPDALQTVASAMRTGHSFAGALAALVEEAPEPAASEFERVITDERLGIELEDALRQTIRRMDNRDLEQVALVAVLQRESGGNGAEALDRVVENLRAREEVRRLVRTLTAQGQMSRWILTLLPVGLLLALSFLGGGYARPLYTTTIGNVVLVVAVVLTTAGSLVIKRLVQIRV